MQIIRLVLGDHHTAELGGMHGVFFFEITGLTMMPMFSGVYMLYFQKKAVGITPLRLKNTKFRKRYSVNMWSLV